VEGRKIGFTMDEHCRMILLYQKVRMGIVKMFFIIIGTMNLLRMTIEFNFIGKCWAMQSMTEVLLVW
jgi:hypothetical protein